MRWKWACILVVLVWATCLRAVQDSGLDVATQASKDGKLLYKLSTPEDLKAILGPPVREERQQDGGMDVLTLTYPDVRALFGRMRDGSPPFTLLALNGKDRPIDIGQDRSVVLRDTHDLAKLDLFWGLAGVDLNRLDLRQSADLLNRMPFDSHTRWPAPDRMPEGFDPKARLEQGKNPGLGIRSLHRQGIDGSGVCIAIIDQPLLRNHVEYTDRIVQYEPIEVNGVPVQMHGSPVCSIAVGRTCGAAPGASLYYYAVPMWKWVEDRPWAETVERIIEQNHGRADAKRIRVVSVSLGAFSERPGFDLWQAAVQKAAKEGILVVTCDSSFLRMGTLRRVVGVDSNDPNSYQAGRYRHDKEGIWVPAGNRTVASHQGPDVYTFDTTGGMSWAVPYLAGLAALAFQVDPKIEPDTILRLWRETATRTGVGPIVNPVGFIEAVRRAKNARLPKSG